MFLRLFQPGGKQKLRPALSPFIRGFSTTRPAGQDSDSRTLQERYIEACKRVAKLERDWLDQRKAASQSSDSSSLERFAPFGWRNENDKQHRAESNLDHPNAWAEAQQEADRHSKYAWVACNYGSKLCLLAGWRYFSLDEAEPNSGVYLISYAWRLPETAYKKRIARSLETGDAVTFPYQPRKILFQAKSLGKAIGYADAFVESVITHPKLLASMERSAEWRDQPSTIKQFHFLQRIGASEELLKDALGSLSKGAAFSFITNGVMRHEKPTFLDPKSSKSPSKTTESCGENHITA